MLTSNFQVSNLAFKLALLVALTPFAIDTYLPAMLNIAVSMNASVNDVSMTIPLFLIGFALGQLVGGPLSDRYGRKPIAYIGLAVFLVCSLLISLSDNVETFYILRFIQAVGGGFATVVSAAIVRDLYSGKESAKVFSMITLVMMVAPLIAPALGAVMLAIGDWQHIFIFWHCMPRCCFS